MANVLKVNIQETVRSLHLRGWSHRRIARELGVNRRTVVRYALELGAKCTISTLGSAEIGTEPKCTISTPGSEAGRGVATKANAGRKSACQPFAATISEKVELGLTARRIYQDLVLEHGFADKYQCVKRFVRRLKATQPARVWRMECEPGEEAQVDFGVGAPIIDSSGKRRRTWVLRVVLSYSRKGYSEAVLRQDTETFLRALENAIRSFGGAPLTLSVDNLKAAVTKADWYDPEINPKLKEFCLHYGTHALPCRPYTPQHKGKVERGVGYVKENALKGRTFASLALENQHLAHWEATIADKRIHGTTRRQVESCFAEERPHLLPLPNCLFPCFQEARRVVHRDGYIEVAAATYEAPPEFIGRSVWVRWDGRCVRIFNDRMEQLQVHVQLGPGKRSRSLGAGGLSTPVRKSCAYWVSQASMLGEHTEQWAQMAVDARGPEALRAIMGLCNLVKNHSASSINTACAKAIKQGARRYKDIRRLLGEEVEQVTFGFVESHPLIRDLGTYSSFIQQTHDHQHPQTTSPQTTPVRAA